jgi:hypothetical protein
VHPAEGARRVPWLSTAHVLVHLPQADAVHTVAHMSPYRRGVTVVLSALKLSAPCVGIVWVSPIHRSQMSFTRVRQSEAQANLKQALLVMFMQSTAHLC